MPNPANPQSLNRYSYCLNNPLKYTDPTGFEPVTGDSDEDIYYRARGYEPEEGEWVYTGNYTAVITSPEQAVKASGDATYVVLLVGGVGTGGYDSNLERVPSDMVSQGMPRDKMVAFHVKYVPGGFWAGDWDVMGSSYDRVVRTGAELVGRTAHGLSKSGATVVAVGHSRGAQIVNTAEHGSYGNCISASVLLSEPFTSPYVRDLLPSQQRITPSDDPVSNFGFVVKTLASPSNANPFGLASNAAHVVDSVAGPGSNTSGHGASMSTAMITDVAGFVVSWILW